LGGRGGGGEEGEQGGGGFVGGGVEDDVRVEEEFDFVVWDEVGLGGG